MARGILDAMTRTSDERSVALGRVLGGAHPQWPGDPEELMFLRIWPAYRAQVGYQLQALASMGASRAELAAAGERLLAFPRGEARLRAGHAARDLSRYLFHDLRSDVPIHAAMPMATDFARDFARYFADDSAPNRYSARIARYFADYYARDFSPDAAYEFLDDFGRCFTRDFLIGDPGSDPHNRSRPRWASDASVAELTFYGRYGVRAALAHADGKARRHPAWHLLSSACHLSLHPLSGTAALEHRLTVYPSTGDPLWPALARHVARRSTPADRALLEDLARHPEKREPPLSWGLRYCVRGDVILTDGSKLSLDQLCDEIGHPHLPYVEDIPNDVDVAWEEDEMPDDLASWGENLGEDPHEDLEDDAREDLEEELFGEAESGRQ